MILIISSEYDESTIIVLKWLKKLKAKYLRVNSINESVTILIDILYDKKKEINSVWYRRKNAFVTPSFKDTPNLEAPFTYSLTQEIKNFNEYIFYSLRHAHWLNHPDIGSLNKLIVLEEARRLGISIADFVITNKKNTLESFQRWAGKIISKPLSNIAPVTHNDTRYIPYTQILQEHAIAKLPDVFFLSFFQKYITKKFEIRSFYLDGEFYSMAIMSQLNSKTKEDFRNYDFDNPNRFLPYKLPIAIEKKLALLMEKLGLNSGSLDLIKSEDGDFYFLEINPVGQFGMVSYPCNYNLEKKIAEKLIQNDYIN